MPTDTKKSIKRLYDEGMAEVFKIVGSLDSTNAQRKVARETAKDLSSMLVAHTLQTIEGRTALLSSLIVELNQVIGSVKEEPRFKGVVDKLTGVLGTAEELFKKEKKSLI